MAFTLDELMERASTALATMDYLTAEALCLKALRAAREAGDWSDYARILLPLQEARRQRRMIAADGVIRLGTSRLEGGPTAWLASMDAGCVVVTHPHSPADARALEDEARRRRRHVEVLYADNTPDAEAWTLRAFRTPPGPGVECTVHAPPASWRETWLPPGDEPMDDAENEQPDGAGEPIDPGFTPADWFIDATEALGDAALSRVAAPEGDPARIEQLEQMLGVVSDHEILHQRLGDAARAMRGRAA